MSGYKTRGNAGDGWSLDREAESGKGRQLRVIRDAMAPTEAVGNSWATLFMSSSKVSIQMPGNDIAPGLLRSDPLYIIHV